MPNINLFVEDRGHEAFLRALLGRFAKQYRIPIKTRFENAKGGHGKVISKLKEESLGKLLKALRQKFQEWERAEHGGPQEFRESPTLYVPAEAASDQIANTSAARIP